MRAHRQQSHAHLLSKYFQKFSKAGKLEFEEGTLGLELDGIQECDEE